MLSWCYHLPYKLITDTCVSFSMPSHETERYQRPICVLIDIIKLYRCCSEDETKACIYKEPIELREIMLVYSSNLLHILIISFQGLVSNTKIIII